MSGNKSPWGNPIWGRPNRRSRNLFTAAKQEEPPASRKPELEGLLCEAIKKHVLVRLFYEDDLSPRTFGPSVVYRTTKDKVCAYGIQANDGPHNFEVGKIRPVSLTEESYEPEPINRSDDRYRNGIICSV